MITNLGMDLFEALVVTGPASLFRMDVYVDNVKRNIAGRGVAARVEEGEEEQYIKAFQDISKVETSSVYGKSGLSLTANSKLPLRRRVSHAAARPRPRVGG